MSAPKKTPYALDKNLTLHHLSGEEARQYINELAEVRIKVFAEFPYIYEGSLDYEREYLETYFQAKHSFVLLVEDQGKIVGASTGIWAVEEEESFNKPFVEHGIEPKKVFYFGESILLPAYRGRGLGKVFMQEREKYARSLPFIEILAFAAVVREPDHPLKPEGYRPLDAFWMSQGFHKEHGLTMTYEWKDLDKEKADAKVMQFWLKHL